MPDQIERNTPGSGPGSLKHTDPTFHGVVVALVIIVVVCGMVEFVRFFVRQRVPSPCDWPLSRAQLPQFAGHRRCTSEALSASR
jgi:hypothetical protein